MTDENSKKHHRALLGSHCLVAWSCSACNTVSSGRKFLRNGKGMCEHCAKKLDDAYDTVVKWSASTEPPRHLQLEEVLLTYTPAPDNSLSMYMPEYRMRIELLEIEPDHVDIYVYTNRLIVDAGDMRNATVEISGRHEAQLALDWFVGHRFYVINGLDMPS